MMVKDTYNDVIWSIDDYITLLNAAENGDLSGVQLMLNRGMDPDTIGPLGWTPLRKAAAANRGEVALELLKRGAAVDATDFLGQTALMIACSYGHHDMVLLLLFYGADPNRKNHSGRTPLMIAAGCGYNQIVGTLLDVLPSDYVTLSDRSGKTARDIAIVNGHKDVAQMLESARTLRAIRMPFEKRYARSLRN